MTPQRFPLVLALIMALVGVVWFVFSLPTPRQGPEPADPSRKAGPAQLPGSEAAETGRTPSEPSASGPVRVEAGGGTGVPAAAHAFARDAVYGRVADLEGRGIRPARIRLFLPDRLEGIEALPDPNAETTSGEGGSFRIPGLPLFQPFRLLAEAEGYGPVFTDAQPGREATITMLREARILGEVRDAASKQPVAGAEVSYRYGDLKEIKVATSPEGAFLLERVPAQFRLNLEAFKMGYAPQRSTFHLREGEERRLGLALRRGVSLAGEVADLESGAPVPGAEIVYFGRTLVRTDAAGRFHVEGLDESRSEIQILAPGYCGLRTDLRPDRASSERGRRFLLLRGGEIEGLVRDPAGRPVVGARVAISQESEEAPLQESELRVPASVPKLPRGSGLQFGREAQGQKTDEKGRFRLAGLVPSSEPYFAQARHPDFPARSSGPVSIARAGEKAFVEIVLVRGAVVEGTVFRGGVPGRAKVNLVAGEEWSEVDTNDRGEYRFEKVPPGEARIWASHESVEGWGGEEQGEALRLEPGQALSRDLKIPELRTQSIAGRVLAASGKPFAGVFVQAWSQSGGRWVNQRARSLADGSYRLEVPDLGGGLFYVSASDGLNSVSRDKVAPGSQGIDLTFAETGRIRLRVVDAGSGEAVPGFQVTWRALGTKRSRSARLYPDASGIVEADLPTGIQDLLVAADWLGYRSVALPGVQVGFGSNPDPIRIELRKGIHLELVLLDEGGRPPAGSHWISLTLIGEKSENRGSFELDEGGAGTAMGLAPGRYRIQAHPSDILLEPAEIELPDQEKVTLPILWKKK